MHDQEAKADYQTQLKEWQEGKRLGSIILSIFGGVFAGLMINVTGLVPFVLYVGTTFIFISLVIVVLAAVKLATNDPPKENN